MKVEQVPHTGSRPQQVGARAIITEDGERFVEVGFQHVPSLNLETLSPSQAEDLSRALGYAVRAHQLDSPAWRPGDED